MSKIKRVSQNSWTKCCCCGEQIRGCEYFFKVTRDDGTPIRGERYCVGCEKYARLNNEITDVADDGEAFLRERETFAAYQAAGCPSAYFDDKN